MKQQSETRCPKAIHGHRYPCPTSDFSFFVIFCVIRAAAPEGTGGDGDLTSIFLNYTEACLEVLRLGERPA